MVIKLRNSAQKAVQKYRRLFTTPEFHAAARNALIHTLLILAIALLFFGVESLIEEFVMNNDAVADFITAAASTFMFLWVRSTLKNMQLATALRERSELYSTELEGRVAEKTERIRQMHDAQSKFLTEIAHEFQTPLAILKGNLAALAKPRIAVAERTNAAYVATTTLDRLSRLIANLLDVAKLKFPQEGAVRDSVDLGKLAEAARDDCALLAEDKNVCIALSIPTGVNADEAAIVAGDKDKLKEVLLNLLSNALRHTPAGGTISIAVTRDGDEAKIAIADTGRGIAPENLPHIFERHYRIANQSGLAGTATSFMDSQGNGLGLHICRQIIEAHGGTIIAESEPGHGSRFILHIPLLPSATRPGSGIINK